MTGPAVEVFTGDYQPVTALTAEAAAGAQQTWPRRSLANIEYS